MELKTVGKKKEKIISISPKEKVKILIQKYPSLIRSIKNSDKSSREFIEMFIFNMEGYLKPVPSNALKDARKKYSDLYETYSVLFSKRNGGLAQYLVSPGIRRDFKN